MGAPKLCPSLRPWADGRMRECAGSDCAWWDEDEGRCAVMTLAGFAAVSMGYMSGIAKSVLCVKKPKKRKEGGDNGE